MKHLVILGSTGSIGRQALEVVGSLPGRLRVIGLVAHSNAELLREQIYKFQPQAVALLHEDAAQRLREVLSGARCSVWSGVEGAERVAALPAAEVVLSALLGAAGLRPTLAAIRAGKQIALANKETLVAAGQVVMREARERGAAIAPVDSEHSALFQCLRGEDPTTIERLILTASGGPFVGWSKEQLESATIEQALNHPNWRMGRKITVDSATLMNKGLELIEARWLFSIDVGKIDVLVHRQSIVHSLVEFTDGSVKAQLGVPDMRLPIQYALLYPDRPRGCAPKLDLLQSRPLTFEPPDEERFPCLRLAREAAAVGGTAPAAMNAANEVAVEAFLRGQIRFTAIPRVIRQTVEEHNFNACPHLHHVLAADEEARRHAKRVVKEVEV